MRRKLATPQRIDEILSRALKKRHVPFRQEDRRLIDIWEKAVGPQIAAQSRPENKKKDVLTVKVSSSVWMHQLHFLKEEIIRKINASTSGVAIKDIHFSIGQLPSSLGKEKIASVAPLPTGHLKERDKKMMETCLGSLRDQELKDIIKRVMTREITLRRIRERKAP
jgi:predicted nucleic acid-binding Zn ribbon protein